MLENLKKYDVVLASGSPRRKELISRLGIDFKVKTLLGIDENFPEGLEGESVVEYVVKKKAKAYHSTMGANELYITADTIVYVDDQIFGKPKTVERAKYMLQRLSGKTHRVSTGVSVFTREKSSTFVATSVVTFAELTEEEINYYVTKYLPIDKAGGYGVQDWIGLIAIEEIQGSFYNVVGLPMQRLYHTLKKF